MGRAVFICGTGTDAGKTLVCAALLHSLEHASAVKIIQTGTEQSDQNIYAQACPRGRGQTISHFKMPASPHLAAAMENRRINPQKLAGQIRQLVGKAQLTLLETSGGIMTPLSSSATFLDLIASLGYPVLLVVNNVLGSINHTLLNLAALRNAHVPLAGLIFTHTSPAYDHNHPIALDNINFIKQHAPIMGVIPYMPELAQNRHAPWPEIAGHLEPARAYLLAHNGPDKTQTPAANLTFDQQHIWHPYCPAPAPRNPPNWLVAKTEGNYIHLQNGRKLLDGMASWWCAIHGYGRAELLRPLQQQAREMAHVMFGGLTHKPAIELGEKLLPLLPAALEKIFWSDSGSVAVEVALKMAVQYWQGMGLPGKNKIISHYGAYHGDTLGAMSVSDPVNGMHASFKGFVPEQIFLPRPPAAFTAPFTESCLEPLQKILEQHHQQCAAIIIEPVVQGAGGMWFYHPQYLTALAKICRQYELLLIYDEIATGFGRTGKMFAAQWAEAAPDIMCAGKALTGGVISLGATICTSPVAEGISRQGRPLMHGPTFMANPLACRAGQASIDLLLSSNWQQRVNAIQNILEKHLRPCQQENQVRDVRVLGAIAVVEMRQPVNVNRLRRYCAEQHGVWLRPFNNLIYVMPPYTVTDDECARLGLAISRAVMEEQWV